MRKKKKLSFHQKIHQHLNKHFHRHIHKVLHFADHIQHHLFHGLELGVITLVTISSGSMLFANLTGLNEQFYRQNSTAVAQELLNAMQNPGDSLKQGNIISIRSMDSDVENSFAKGYCTYGAARISPEFFPFIDTKTQQRTWGGNAVDRCKNASDTGYKIGSTPIQGALIIYDAGGKFGSYGHVGKVLHYDKQRNKIIVRDMAWVAKGMMSDRREDPTTANVKCYIYNNKTAIPDPTPPVIIPATPIVTPDIPVITPVAPVVVPIVPVVRPTIPVVRPVVTTPVVAPVIVPTTPVIVPVVPVIPPVINVQTLVSKDIELTLDNLSDIATHFLTQNDLVISIVSKTPLGLGEVATFTLSIKDKKSGNPYSGLLPFSFTLLPTNDTIESNISNINLIDNGSIDISILGQKIGTASIVITMDEVKIGEFSIEVR